MTIDMTKVAQLEAKLRLMRAETAEYAEDADHDPKVLLKRRSECANLDGAINCYKRGETPVIEAQAKFLR